ncbi:phytoene desaturase family protein [Paraoerskovia marina]|uniref:phytoene desaturase family protein n=1 Tax=Paraoerskovia marina TaxID=545619 RepID=UPI0005B7EDFF|nr:phytoene desaturase family protein [Paraoerskovia marina]
MGSSKIVVVGGGVGGLATAALLARGGADVTLLERNEQVGGRAGSWEVDGFRFDTGPSWYLMPEVFEHFFALLGENIHDHLDLVTLDPAYRVFFETPDGAACREEPGHVLDVGDDLATNLDRFDTLEPGAGARVSEYVKRSGDAYRMALEHFLYTTFERPDRLVDGDVLRRLPRLATLLSSTLEREVARTVDDHRLRQVLGYHAVFLGSAPGRVPALYSLMSHLDLADGVRYPRGGMYTLVEAMERLAIAEGVTIRTSTEVAAIETERTGRRRGHATGRVTGVRLTDGETIAADVVVSGSDRHHTETALLPPELATYPESYWERRGPGISALLVLAGVRGELPELAHHSLFFTRDWDTNFRDILGTDTASSAERLRAPDPASIYVSRTSATDTADSPAPAAPPGHENLFVLVPFPADESMGADAASQAELEALADRYLAQIGTWAGVEDLPGRVTTRTVLGPAHFDEAHHAWRGTALGMEHTLAQSAMFRPPGASDRVSGLYHVGAGAAPGVGLPMCIISAELVVKRLLGETSARPLPTPLRRGFLDASRRPERTGRA